MHRRTPFTFALLNILFLQVTGTVLFHFVEDWSFVDAFYYTGMTITTIGTADPSPQSTFTKILAVLFAYYAITLAIYCLAVVKPRIDEILTGVFDKLIFWKKLQ